MTRKSILVSLVSATTLLSLGIGCTTISTDTKANIAVPNYPATAPSSVEILQVAPTAPHMRLGEITLTISGTPTKEQIRTRFQEASAKLGANAVVIVMDRTMVLGAYVTGPWWGREVSPDTGRVIVGVPIRYTAP